MSYKILAIDANGVQILEPWLAVKFQLTDFKGNLLLEWKR